jgi:hypothetical protein
MKELDRIKVVGHVYFELLLEGSNLGCNFGNCWNWGDFFYKHGRHKKLLKLDKKRQYDLDFCWYLKP